MRYLLWGYYGYGNLGDELMLEVLAKRIREKNPDTIIYVKCPEGSEEGKNFMPLSIDKEISEARKKYLATVPSIVSKISNAISKTDALVIGGGTIFVDKGKHNYSLMILALAVLIAKMRRKKVFVVGTGMDRLSNGISRRYVEYILRNSDYICMRDKYSYEEARGIVGEGRVSLGSDLLYSDQRILEAAKHDGASDGKVLLSVIDYFKRLEPDAAGRKALAASLVSLAEEIINGGKKLVLVSMQKQIGERDLEYAQEIIGQYLAAHPEKMNEISIIHIDGAGRLAEAYRDAGFVIGMRYHALVLASIFGIPFIGIDHEKKIGEICREYGMPAITTRELLENGAGFTKLIKSRAKPDSSAIKRNMELSENNFRFLEMMR